MTWRNRNLYLIGLPGSGKSALGRELAKLLDRYEFVDLDAEIERCAGSTISDIFLTKGEAGFRELESASLLQLASGSVNPRIVATGGGIVLSALNRSIMRGSGIPIWIDVTVREAAKNVLQDVRRGHVRPMFPEPDSEEIKKTLTKLLDERRPWYEQAVLHFVSRNVDGNARPPEELAGELLTALDQMSLKVALKPRHRTIVAKSALGNYPVLVGNGIAIRELGYFAKEHGYSQIVVVADENVECLHGEAFRSGLRNHIGMRILMEDIVIPAGEANKNLDTLQHILKQFNALGASRRTTLVVAFGGGVVTDMTAFAANLYHRGLPLVLVPTTLIAEADAAIGGKTGVDAFGNKNAIGTFYPPSLVVVDPMYLRTLPSREVRAGLVEVIKYALIGNPEMWNKLTKQIELLTRGMGTAYEAIIIDSIQEKLRYVERDEFERAEGIRELLNFGHTFGHALESATQFKALLHGEAVLLGMRASAWLSKELGYLSAQEYTEIELVLGKIPFEQKVESNTESVLAAFRRDKKGMGRVVLLRLIGDAFVSEITEADARRAIDRMLSVA